MSRLIATRVSDEHYSKIMGKCAGLGCSVYDYLKMLVETDITETTRADQKQTRYGRGDQERARRIRELLRQAEERQSAQTANQSDGMHG